MYEHLLNLGKYSDERFSTNKPKDYGKVCQVLDSMANEDLLVFLEDLDKKDRTY
ncbi:DUF3895 domain-containing protein [Niallia taxi]|uniref:DUF3895 domain-containing protein n=1 Tax=Niallia taxi TaxID=2499688 RepID=UPI003CCC8673